jgi:hypothetical protein
MVYLKNTHRLTYNNRPLYVDKEGLKLKFVFTSQTIFELNLKKNYIYSAKIVWGDNTTQQINIKPTSDTKISHVYQSGTYILSIRGVFQYLDITNNQNLTSVVSWGDVNKLNIRILDFTDCSGLISLPNEDAKLKYAERIKFVNCTSLQEIPSGLLKENTIITDLTALFYNCSSLTTIPSGLFDDNINVYTFFSTFNNTSITSIPNNLFDNNTIAVRFTYTFSNTDITSIPVDLFKYCTNITDLYGTFAACNSLTSIPYTIFDYNLSIIDLTGVFSDCISLNGCTPKLWDTAIWPNINAHDNAFKDCSGLDNYSTPTSCSAGLIPSSWT